MLYMTVVWAYYHDETGKYYHVINRTGHSELRRAVNHKRAQESLERHVQIFAIGSAGQDAQELLQRELVLLALE